MNAGPKPPANDDSTEDESNLDRESIFDLEPADGDSAAVKGGEWIKASKSGKG